MTTASYSTCSQCGAELPGDAPQGVCPKCMLGLGLGATDLSGQSAGPTRSQGGGGRFTPPSPAELAPWFPQLEILGLLGHGGMGAVYKARQKGLDRLVALKILPIEFGRDEAFMQRFSREAKALARLDHPNIVTVHDFGRAGDLCFFVMEFVDGVNLRQLRQTGALDPKTALALVPQICEALQFAHDQGVVHRDIKPENILVDKRGRVKIADFGLAKLLGQGEHTLTGSNQAMGTFHYMAPEQLAGAGAVDHRADIYSLGVVFYELLTGNLPVGRFAPPSKKVQIDVRLDEVVLRALEAEPGLRYQQASEVKTDVESICGLSSLAGRELPPHLRRAFGYEYRSKTTFLGWPLVHIATGVDPATMKKRVAKGWFAFGDVAIGGVAMGGCAVGVFAIGGCAVGAFTLGGLSLGLLVAFGGMAIGALAMGGGALGIVAIGGGAVGVYAYGGGAFGVHAMGGNVRDPAAVEFFQTWGPAAFRWFTLVSIVSPFLMIFMAAAIYVAIWLQRRREHVTSPSAMPGKPSAPARADRGNRGFWFGFVLAALMLLLVPAIAILVLGSYYAARQARRAEMGAQVDAAQEAELLRLQQQSRESLGWRTGWEMTSGGPVLHQNAIRALQLDQSQVKQVNAALQEASEKARQFERETMTSEINDRGRRVTIIPHSPVVDELENEFWSQVDAILSLEQQRIARANLRVRGLDAQAGVYLHHLTAPGLFGYLETGARIETWRVGTWYHWNVTVRGHTSEQSAPDAPLLYRQYWEDPVEPAAPPSESS